MKIIGVIVLFVLAYLIIGIGITISIFHWHYEEFCEKVKTTVEELEDATYNEVFILMSMASILQSPMLAVKQIIGC